MSAAAKALELAAKPQAQRHLVLGALGVVFGDIGTSPLYALRLCFAETHDFSPAGVYGVLSLVAWALAIVVLFKYILVVMRADNRGEGGVLALSALVLRAFPKGSGTYVLALTAGLIGASLFYGDGVITPAISVLSAVEGLEVVTPLLKDYVLPVTLVLLIGVFVIQQRGTGEVGRYFGPVMALWFAVLGLTGIIHILQEPTVLIGLNPYWGIALIASHPWKGFILLGAVVLAVTGGEALYADMGHFGRRAITTAWMRFVFPALLLNYFGQGALLLHDPSALANPFFRMVPGWATLPLVILASAATIIASQAVISGAFAITSQAVQLGYLPRMLIRHTSAHERGQVYVPRVNFLLLIAVLGLVLGFRSSNNLGSAYGIAVTGAMAIDTILAYVYMVRVQHWSILPTTLLFGLFLATDASFFSANLLKFLQGGWVPVVIGGAVVLAMSTWIKGRRLLAERRRDATIPLASLLARVKPGSPIRIPGTSVFMTGNVQQVPASLLHNLKHNKTLHERVVLMCVKTADIPRVPEEERLEIHHLDHNFHTITAKYGFTEEPNIWRVLAQCRLQSFPFKLMETSVFVGREKIVASDKGKMAVWRKKLFVFLSNNAINATEFFHIPSNLVIELGGQTEI
jgi:KUP system potassium uptake protein